MPVKQVGKEGKSKKHQVLPVLKPIDDFGRSRASRFPHHRLRQRTRFNGAEGGTAKGALLPRIG